MTRKSAKEVIRCGIVFTFSVPKELPPDKGRTNTRWECLISTKIEGSKQKLFEIKKIRLSRKEAVLARIESEEDIRDILTDKNNFDKLVALAKENAFRVSAYLYLLGKSKEILMSSGVKQETMDKLMSGNNTMRVFDEIYLDLPIGIKEVQTKLKKSLNADKLDESKDSVASALALLSAVFAEAMKGNLSHANPYGRSSYSKSARTKIIEKMSRRSLSDDESTAFMIKCLDGLTDGNLIYGVILLCFLAGLTVYEACALNWEDWQTTDAGDVSWLCITKEIYQIRYKKAKLRYKLRSLFQYRKMVCTEEVEQILRVCMSIHFEEGDSELSGLIFCDANGDHFLPDRVKQRVNKLLDEIFPHDGLNMDGINTRFGRKDKRAVTRGAILRRNFEYILRYKSKMEPSEIQAIMGITPDDTYAHSYVDWGNVDVLRCERAKLERWHKQLAANMSSAKDAYLQIAQTLLVTVPQDEDAIINVISKHKTIVSVDEKEKYEDPEDRKKG